MNGRTSLTKEPEWWLTPAVINQEGCKFEASLNCTARSCRKKTELATELAMTASQVAQQGRFALPRQVVCLIPGTHPRRRELTVRSCLWLSSAYCVPLHKLKIIIATTTTTKEHLVILKENKTSLFVYAIGQKILWKC